MNNSCHLNDYTTKRRESLKVDIRGTNESAALLSFVIYLLNLDKKELSTILRVCSRQGYTPTDTKYALRRLVQANLIEYVHHRLTIYVQLNDAGRQFFGEV